jgi:hypothetical protein
MLSSVPTRRGEPRHNFRLLQQGDVKDSSVPELISSLGGPRKEMLERMRAVVRRTLPEATETVKWGQPVYSLWGKNIICFMIYDDHVNFGLFMGARLKAARLEGTGKGLRHVKVYTIGDIDEKEFSRLARDAAKLV